MGFQFHLICEYKAIKVLFLHPMRMLDPNAKQLGVSVSRDEESSQKAQQCPDTRYTIRNGTSGFRAGWYGTSSGYGEGIQKNGFQAGDVPRCWGASAAALHFSEPHIWPWVHDQEIMHDFVASSWEMWSDRTHAEFRLSQGQSSIARLTKSKSPNIHPYIKCGQRRNFACNCQGKKAKFAG